MRDRKPAARTTELLVEEFGDELLVYDQRSDRVHCLSPPAQQVWRACDGRTSVERLRAALDLDAEVVVRALEELEACELLEAGVTRREAAVGAAKVGAAAAAGALIYSVAAPPPALAVSQAVCHGFTGAGSNPGCGQIAGAKNIIAACNAAGCVMCGFSGCASSQCPGLTGTSGYCMAATCSTSTCNLTTMINQCCNGSISSGCACSGLTSPNCTTAQCGP